MMSKVTFLRVTRIEQQFCAEMDSFFSRPFVYASSPIEALRRLHRHPSAAPWSGRIARVIRDYNLGFGPITDAHLSHGVSMATMLPLDGSA